MWSVRLFPPFQRKGGGTLLRRGSQWEIRIWKRQRGKRGRERRVEGE
jgi:hypothetical protein